jgi:hypothetical protein
MFFIGPGASASRRRPHQARRLLELIEVEEFERAALAEDATAFVEEALV